VQGNFNVVADELYSINESPSTELYMGSEDDEDSDVVALNVVGTVGHFLVSPWRQTCYGHTRRIRPLARNSIIRKYDGLKSR
jgi:hypothetical protein